MDIDGSVCIITGASSGIGAATARLLASEGAAVVLAARRAERLNALARELPNALAVPTDITAPEHVEQLIASTLDAFGAIDVLVNNAGQGLHVPLSELEPADLRAVFELNVIAPLQTLKAALPTLLARPSAAIVNVSSATSLRVFPGLGGYAATKAALNMLSQTAAAELSGTAVKVSVVYPSVTETEFHQHLRAGAIVSAGRRIPPDPPELVAETIAFAIESGEEHVLVSDPPRPIVPGSDDAWAALLARQTPRAGSGEDGRLSGGPSSVNVAEGGHSGRAASLRADTPDERRA